MPNPVPFNLPLRVLARAMRWAMMGWVVFGFMATSVGRSQDTDWGPTAKSHAWGRFGPRVWKVTRMRTESFDEQGELDRSSVTITRTQVNAVGKNSLSLSVRSTVAVAGQEFPSNPQIVTYDLEPPMSGSQKIGEQVLTVGKQDFVTEVYRLITQDQGEQRINTVYVCRESSPQVLKRVTKTLDNDSGDVKSETTVEVTGVGQKIEILGAERTCWSVVTQTHRTLANISMREVYCADVPGELVSRVTEERNAQGQVVQRSELEVTGYGIGNRRRRLFGRRRPTPK